MNVRIARLLCVAALLVASLPAGAEAARARRIKILVLYPKLVRNVNRSAVDPIYNQIVAEVRKLFPCAAVTTEDANAAYLKLDREVKIRTGTTDYDLDELLYELYSADLVIGMEFGSTGTTNNSPGRYMTTTVMQQQNGKSVSRDTASDEGWSWGPNDFVQETLKPFRAMAYDVCPWLGTIQYTRKSNDVDDKTETVQEADGTRTITVVYTTKSSKVEDEDWTFEITKNHLSAIVIDTHGQSTMKSDAIQKTEWASKSCFPQQADGTVRDTGYVTGVSDLLTDRQWANGEAKGILRGPRVKWTLNDETKPPTWTMSVEGKAYGNQKTGESSERSGGCGTWSKPTPEADAPFGRLITVLVDELNGSSDEIKKTIPINASPGLSESVTINVSRK
jgi:hypothetical protein